MSIEIKLPELGDGIESGDVLDVLVSEGDSIEKDQAVCELETDKATVEVPSSHAGKVTKIHIAAGQSIPIGAVLVTVEAETGAAAPPTPSPAPAAEQAPAPPVEPAPPETPAPEPPPADVAPTPATTPVTQPANVPSVPAPVATESSVVMDTSSAAAPAGPAIRRLAREVGINLNTITGSGDGGRITRDDVLAAVRRSSAAGATPASPVVGSSSAPSAASQDTEPITTASTDDDWGPVRVERLSKIRRTIAAKMHESWSTVPRVTNYDDADVTEMERIRQASKPDYARRGLKLTSMPFVIKAVALALKQNPIINASLDEVNEQIIYKEYVNLGIAVDTDRGLVVPSLRRPDELGIAEISRSLTNIAENARSSSFKIEDLRGSTFTISNLGAVGGTYSTPIINVPEVAILLLGRSRKMPVVIEDDQIEVRLMMPLSLSYDHRLVDGGAAARFLNDVIEFLENPSRLLIAP